MKEVEKHEWQGGFGGLSFGIAPGIRYHVGGSQGKSVVVGTKLQEADYGILTITSQRAVFKGARQTVECDWAKLIALNVFTDGIQFHVEDRQTAPLFKLGDGDEMAAVVNAAIQKQLH
jgi:hypothetical protein